MRRTLNLLLRDMLLAAVCMLALPGLAANVCGHGDSLLNPQAIAPGLGGTGNLAIRPGIGGTGNLALEPGIGGTGIVGVITGFASICVNGVEVHYDDATPISDNGIAIRAGVLEVGQLVVVQALGNGDELQARRVALLHLAEGPVDEVDMVRGELRILGQTAHWSARPDQWASMRPGAWVRVSGYRLGNGELLTTHLQPASAQAQVQLTGVAEVRGGNIRIGTAVISTSALGFWEVLRTWWAAAGGKELHVQGEWNGERILANNVRIQPTRALLGTMGRVVLEGYARNAGNDHIDLGQGAIALGGTVSAAQREALLRDPEQRIRVFGSVDASGHWIAERIEIRDTPAAHVGRASGPATGGPGDPRNGTAPSPGSMPEPMGTTETAKSPGEPSGSSGKPRAK
ncbi:DUF5666 domain-containing protein [Rhodoferax saidenbachensis]|uniref:DUF5666 domain-containing protein n=1 Tax=Rhodoferax saidenbachensis TaxID=1484693 RepID=A0ABU1ZS33_9BURK|nr:DUF5666 domain-containing protein [Rhodoferax saidenbachensis]MDR7308288.1 hypothetical protein [Rhodoferax saidenbachensis]